MCDHVCDVVSSDAEFPGLWALLNSVYADYGGEYRVFIVGYGVLPDSLAALQSHPLRSVLTLLDSRDFAYPAKRTHDANQSALAQPSCGGPGLDDCQTLASCD